VSDHEVGSGFRARRVRAGSEVCLIGIGNMLANVERAAEVLVEDGIDATVWDARVVQPLDEVMLTDAAHHGTVVTVEDGIREGGVGMAIEGAIASPSCQVTVLGVPAAFLPHGRPDRILASIGLDTDGIVASVRAAIGARALLS
jgi:1-deoxy-D-xylulose-5-phosphate synthase